MSVNIDPIFITVKETAHILALSTWSVYKKLDQQVIESKYEGTKRVVSYASVQAYAKGLPTSAPVAEAS